MAGTSGASINLTLVRPVFGGHPLMDRPKGAFVTINYLSDQVTLVQGIDSSYFIENDDLSAEVILRVMQHSPSNDIFSAFHFARLSKKLIIKGPVTGLSVFSAAHAKIAKWPTVVYSDAGEIVEWRLLTPRLVPFVGGIPPQIVV